MEQTTRQAYIRALAVVQKRVYEMGMASITAVQQAMQAFLQQDRNLAAQVMDDDDKIDHMIVDIEDRCILLIAKQQPMAHDLRVIATGFKISTDIERIGDHAFDIAKTALDFSTSGQDAVDFSYTPQLAECAAAMLGMAMQAYQTADIMLAEQVCKRDDEMDELFAKTFLELSQQVTNEAQQARRITQLLFVARFLERIGDHAVNIAEWVIYLETAERIRKNRKKNPSVVS